MDFFVEKNSKYRLGKIQCKEYSLNTPTSFLYTKLGSVPYLSQDVLKRTNLLPSIVQMPINQLMEHMTTIKLFPQGLRQFTSMQGKPLYCSVQDPVCTVPSLYNNSSGIALWNKSGKEMLNASKYMDCIEDCMPDWFECLYDGSEGGKRTARGVDRSVQLLDDCLSRLQQSQKLKGCKVFGVVVGGVDEDECIRSAQLTSLRSVDGFSIAGFHGPHVCQFDFRDIETCLKRLLYMLPQNKPRLMHGPMNPSNLLLLASLGFDLFDSSYAHLVTECEGVLNLDIFNFEAVSLEQGDGVHIKCNKSLSTKSNSLVTADVESSPNKDDTQADNDDDDIKYNIIFPRDKRYHDDEKPLLIGCECLTCTEHSRAYIHHLIITHELLASILITIHNTHHYKHLVEVVRKSLEEDRVDELRRRLECRVTPDVTEVLMRKKNKKMPSFRRNNDDVEDGNNEASIKKATKKKKVKVKITDLENNGVPKS